SPSSPRAGPSPPSCTRRDGGGAAGRRQAWGEDGSQRMRKSQIEKPRDRIALSRFCYRRQKTLAPQGPRKLPKLDVAGSTPVARSREFEEVACCRQEPDGGGGSLVTLCSRGFTRQGHRTPPALGLHPPRQNGSATDAAASTRQPTVAGLP